MVSQLDSIAAAIATHRSGDPFLPIFVLVGDRVHAEVLGRRMAIAGVGALGNHGAGSFAVSVGTVGDLSALILGATTSEHALLEADPEVRTW